MLQVNLALQHCVYITIHPLGYIYAGKGKTESVSRGTYKGSGIRLNEMFLKEGFEFHTWQTIIVKTFEGADEAFSYERILVSALRSNPKTLNLAEGGLGGSGMTGKSHTEDTRRKISEAAKSAGENAALRHTRSVNLKALWDNPEFREKRLRSMRTPQAIQRRKEAALTRVGWKCSRQTG